MPEWTPRPEDLDPAVGWWGCCETTGGSPVVHYERPLDRDPDADVEIVQCPHCHADVTEHHRTEEGWP